MLIYVRSFHSRNEQEINHFHMNRIVELCKSKQSQKDKEMTAGRQFLSRKLPAQFLPIIDEAARKVFGTLPITDYRTGNKILKQKLTGPIWSSYYGSDPSKPFRIIPGFQTDLEEARAESLAVHKANGNGPPKKGQGKRVTKKK